jgi:hypothetical protein
MITFGAAFMLLLTEAWLLTKLWPERWRPKPARRPKQSLTPTGVDAVPALAAPPQSDAP